MQSNQTNQQGQVKFMVGDKVKYKEGAGVVYHNPETIYTVEEVESDGLITLVGSDYVAYPSDLALVSRPTKHKHYDLIIEWAKDPENVIVQCRPVGGDWRNTTYNSPWWRPGTEYRIKPKTKQVTRWKWAFLTGGDQIMESTAYYTEDEAIEEFTRATPYKLKHTAITETVEV